MKKFLKIMFSVIILFLFFLVLFTTFKREKISNLIRETFIWNDRNADKFNSESYYILTWTSEFSKTIYIPVVTNKENIQFKLDAYDINWPILFTMLTDYQDWYEGEIYPFFVHTLFWKDEFIIPTNAITKIDEDIFEIKLDDFWGYTTFDGESYLYKIFDKWEIKWVFLSLWWTNTSDVSIDFSLLE